jgi:GNAT superfamily N-acetyltransferase
MEGPMKMWQPDRPVTGPYPAGESDIAQLNRLFSEAFTDRYRRDGLVGVRVPPLSRVIWTYALRDAGPGALVWRDEDGLPVAFNMVHQSGTEGWMGPLAVRPDRQGLGLGSAVVRTAIDWLKAAGTTTVGLETMPRTVENIGFYSRLGFLPGYLTVTLTGEVTGRSPGAARGAIRLAELPDDERTDLLGRCRRRLARAAPGYDFTREHELTRELDVGDTLVIERNGEVQGFALWHSAPLAESRQGDEIRVLKLFAANPAVFLGLVRATEACAARLRTRRVAVRCQSRLADAYTALIRRGYQTRWTDLRMTLAGYPEAVVPEGEVLFSNWEV